MWMELGDILSADGSTGTKFRPGSSHMWATGKGGGGGGGGGVRVENNMGD